MSDEFLTGFVIGIMAGAALLDLFNLLVKKWDRDGIS